MFKMFDINKYKNSPKALFYSYNHQINANLITLYDYLSLITQTLTLDYLVCPLLRGYLLIKSSIGSTSYCQL